MQAEKPDIMLGVICGSLHIAEKTINAAFQEFQNSLERGQIQASNTLTNVVDIELINDGHKYKVQATKSGPNTYFLVMNGSFKEIELHRLSDGGKQTFSSKIIVLRMKNFWSKQSDIS